MAVEASVEETVHVPAVSSALKTLFKFSNSCTQEVSMVIRISKCCCCFLPFLNEYFDVSYDYYDFSTSFLPQ